MAFGKYSVSTLNLSTYSLLQRSHSILDKKSFKLVRLWLKLFCGIYGQKQVRIAISILKYLAKGAKFIRPCQIRTLSKFDVAFSISNVPNNPCQLRVFEFDQFESESFDFLLLKKKYKN